jgi:hypothetical protein
MQSVHENLSICVIINEHTTRVEVLYNITIKWDERRKVKNGLI